MITELLDLAHVNLELNTPAEIVEGLKLIVFAEKLNVEAVANLNLLYKNPQPAGSFSSKVIIDKLQAQGLVTTFVTADCNNMKALTYKGQQVLTIRSAMELKTNIENQSFNREKPTGTDEECLASVSDLSQSNFNNANKMPPRKRPMFIERSEIECLTLVYDGAYITPKTNPELTNLVNGGIVTLSPEGNAVLSDRAVSLLKALEREGYVTSEVTDGSVSYHVTDFDQVNLSTISLGGI